MCETRYFVGHQSPTYQLTGSYRVCENPAELRIDLKTEVESVFDTGFVVGWGIADIGSYVGLYEWHKKKEEFGWTSMSAEGPTDLGQFI